MKEGALRGAFFASGHKELCQAGAATVVMAALLIGASLMAERDEWHRVQALKAVAVGFTVIVIANLVDAIWLAASSAHQAEPGRALAAAAASWMGADFWLRQRVGRESGGS